MGLDGSLISSHFHAKKDKTRRANTKAMSAVKEEDCFLRINLHLDNELEISSLANDVNNSTA